MHIPFRTFVAMTATKVRAMRLTAMALLLVACSTAADPSTPSVAPGVPDFALDVSPPGQIQAGGQAGVLTVAIKPIGGFVSPVSVTIEGLPPGTVTDPVLPASVIAGSSAIVSLRVPRSAEARGWQVKVRGIAESLIREAQLNVSVTGAADFDVVVPMTDVTLRRGTTRSVAIAINALRGFIDTVTITLTAPSGLTVVPTSIRIAPGQAAMATISTTARSDIGNTALSFSAGSPLFSRQGTIPIEIVPDVWYHRNGNALIVDRIEGADSVRLVVDAAAGAVVRELSLNGRNFLSTSAANRGIQTVAFDGLYGYDDCRGCNAASVGFMPTQEGDRLGNKSSVSFAEVGNNALHAGIRLNDWAPDVRGAPTGRPMPTDVTVEQWITAVPTDPRAFSIRYRVTHTGFDLHRGAAQWLPAVHVPPELDRFTSYAGTAPWTNGTVTSSTWGPGEPARTIATTEHWGAWSGSDGAGIALYVPGDYPFMKVWRDRGGYPNGATPFNRMSSQSQHDLRPLDKISKEVFVVLGDVASARQSIARLRSIADTRDVLQGIGHIDVPSGGDSEVRGVFAGRGWAIDNVQITRIEIAIDGAVRATSTPTQARPDLAIVYPGVSLLANFQYSFNTLSIPDGPHDLTARIMDAAGNVVELAPRRVLVNNSGVSVPRFDVVVGGTEIVVNGETTACSVLDILDEPARAVRLADGSLILAAPNAPVNYIFRGSGFTSLRKDCKPVLSSPASTSPSSWAHWYWISSLYREGSTLHALLHSEYHDPFASNCKLGDLSPANRCWYNSISAAASTDNGATFSTIAAPEHVVAPPPETWDPNLPFYCYSSSFFCPHYGYENPTNIFVGPDGAYYSAFRGIPGAQTSGQLGTCMMRTSDLSDPQSWRAWDGTRYGLAMLDPYRVGRTVSACEFIDRNLVSTPTAIVYSTYLAKYVAVFPMFGSDGVCGVGYSISDDLIRWSKSTLLITIPMAGTVACRTSPNRRAGSSIYPSIIDHSSSSPNFDTIGQSAFVYLVRYTGESETQRELIRIPVTFSKR